jgi:hypothetical protein
VENSLVLLGRIAGFVGILMCLTSGVARLSGMHWLGGFETLTLLQGGIAGMVFGCFFLLLALSKDAGIR